MAGTANHTFWGFVRYLKGNPFKDSDGMTNDDIDDMAEMFAVQNSDEITDATDPGTYTSIEYPTIDGTGVAIDTTENTLHRANWPERHRAT
jgi:hypothetical protein